MVHIDVDKKGGIGRSEGGEGSRDARKYRWNEGG